MRQSVLLSGRAAKSDAWLGVGRPQFEKPASQKTWLRFWRPDLPVARPGFMQAGRAWPLRNTGDNVVRPRRMRSSSLFRVF